MYASTGEIENAAEKLGRGLPRALVAAMILLNSFCLKALFNMGKSAD
jgi:hypothetical protein